MRAAGQKEYVNLAKGLITESSPLSFPEGATSSELNFVVNKDGFIRERRKGFEYIYPLTTFGGSDSVLENMFYWRGSTYVVTILTNTVPETYLRVHALDATFTALIDVKIADAAVSTQIAELTNYLVITLSNGTKPILLEFKEVDQTIEVFNVSLHLRDFELVDDGLSISENPVVLSENHEYNLYNAGWYEDKKDENQVGYPLTNVVIAYQSALAVTGYPSNADSVGVGMITNGDGELTFDPEYVRDAGLGNSLSPRGHYVFPIDNFVREDKRLDRFADGAPSTTLTAIGSVDFSSAPSYDPDVPVDPDLPFAPYPDIDRNNYQGGQRNP